MGAETFATRGKGKTARAAFDAARDQALYDHGHAGYSGTLAEKHSFVVIPVPEGADPVLFAQQLIDDGDERINNKWGPAGCVALGNDEYLFFGWASS